MKKIALSAAALVTSLLLAGPLEAQTRPSFYERPAPAAAAKCQPAAGIVCSIPARDANGDYKGRSLHRYWQVVNEDRRDLIGRVTKEWPSNWDCVDANWPSTSDVAQWPEAARFSPGSVLLAATGNMGIIFVNDSANKPWLMINSGIGRVCFVPANSRYIIPVSLDTRTDCGPDAQGNFSGAQAILQKYWIVNDRDPNGLNGRLAKEWPSNWDHMDANWPDTSMIRAWPVVDQFKHGEVLSAVFGNRGAIMVFDAAKKPWLLVRRHNGEVCFVRANQGFISPVATLGVAEAARNALVERALSLHRAGKKAEVEAMINDISRDGGFPANDRDMLIREITRVLNAETMK